MGANPWRAFIISRHAQTVYKLQQPVMSSLVTNPFARPTHHPPGGVRRDHGKAGSFTGSRGPASGRVVVFRGSHLEG